MIEERITSFDISADGVIHVRKTTFVLVDGEVIGSRHWRTVLQPHDPNAEAVLGAEPFYLSQAQYAWANANLPESAHA